MGCRPYGRGLKNFYRLRALESRFQLDDKRGNGKLLYDMNKSKRYKNLFFLKKQKMKMINYLLFGNNIVT